MRKQSILIVEDERKLSRVLELELNFENYLTAIANDGKEALQLISNKRWDLVLLDIMLPKLSGLELLREIRQTDQQTPIILLTARDQVHDKVRGLDLGANDYVTKPFQIEELLARIRVHLRDQTEVETEEKQFLTLGELTINLQTRDVNREGRAIELTPREYDLLVYLVKNKNIVLTRDQLIERVWGYEYGGNTNVVDVYIRYLRQKIDKGFKVSMIRTIRGVGYVIKDENK